MNPVYKKRFPKLGFFYDSERSGNWTWEKFINSSIGMSGTDSQFLLLAHELSNNFSVTFFTNIFPGSHATIDNQEAINLEDVCLKIKNFNIDILIFNNRNDENTKSGIVALNKIQQPFILWDQNGPAPHFEDLLTQSHYLKRIICVSRSHANFHRHKTYYNKVAYIYNGKDYPTPTESDTILKRLAFIGAISETKGFHHVVKAWPQIKKAHPTASLIVIGSIKLHDKNRPTGDLEIAEPLFEDSYIKPYIGSDKTLIESNGVYFTGQITFKEICEVLKTVQLGIVNPNCDPYGLESFCVSALDFQGNCIPVIGGGAGGLLETVNNGETGLLIKKSDDLAETVISLLNNRKQYSYLKSNTHTWVQNKFSRRIINGQWMQLIDKILNGERNKIVPLDIRYSTWKDYAKEAVRIFNNVNRYFNKKQVL